jgi:hypothetical protein
MWPVDHGFPDRDVTYCVQRGDPALRKSLQGFSQRLYRAVEASNCPWSFGMRKRNSASRLRSFSLGAAAIAAGLLLCPDASRADESGTSFWLPGQFASLVAAPATAGWALGIVYYHASVNASGAAAAAREFQVGRFSPAVNINLNLNLGGQSELVFVAPSYTFAQPVFGGQLAVAVAGVYGRNAASIAGTLTATAGPLVTTFAGMRQDALVSVGDLSPIVSLTWNKGVHNFMVYGAGEIPVGDYSPNRLANLGIGHGAVDAGAGYTYFNPATGNELSGIGGFTYNFINPQTNYQSGIDFHFDWGVSHFMSKQMFVGLVGYAYQQITDDFGQPAILGGFRSRVFGIGPQIGYNFQISDKQAVLGLRGYREFAAENRPSGWNTFLTFSISSVAPTGNVRPTKHVTK